MPRSEMTEDDVIVLDDEKDMANRRWAQQP
jgi:hypothetical protein